MANKKKMTVVEKFEAIANMLAGDYTGEFTREQAQEFLAERITHTRKKNASSTGDKKLTPEQVANEGIKDEILALLSTATEPMSLGEMMKRIEGIKSNQHISALVTQLKNTHKVVRVEVKGKAHFRLPTAEESAE